MCAGKMGAPRRKSRLVTRRRTDDDGEDEGSVMAGDDSLSEASVPSDVDDDADGEGSETSEVGTPSKRQNGQEGLPDPGFENGAAAIITKSSNPGVDTHIMMNGLTIADGSGDQIDEIDFDDVHSQSAPTVNLPSTQLGGSNDSTGATKMESITERRRREHEEYKKRRDADPAFVPNRGNFFMHDQRSSGQDAQGQAGFGAPTRGKGRGRGGFGSQAPGQQRVQPEDGPWMHDLHQTVAGLDDRRPEPAQTAADSIPDNRPKPAPRSNDPPPNRDFSSTTPTGVVNCQVFIHGMKTPIPFSGVPQNLHVRLPHHRPPLRRDKPVRVSLPDSAPSYIFPVEYRSFIFIPRALRPNQQGFGRPRGRGSIGGPGGLRSGRNSMYGGSVYTPSVAMSRRSSFARDREGMASPAMSIMSRVTGHGRVQPGGPPMIQPHMYKPGPPTGYAHVPMHQPRPTKNIPMPEVESPGLYPPSGAQQPFAHQVPAQYGGDYRPDSRRTSYPSQRGTPLNQIPERAMQSQGFQPHYSSHIPQGPMHGQAYQQIPPPHPHQAPPPPPMYYHPQPYPQQQAQYPYYYPQQAMPGQQPTGPAPPPVPGQQGYGYMPAPPAPHHHHQVDANGQQATVAHESNGTVYYYDQSQMDAAAVAYQGGMMPYGVQQPYMHHAQGAMYYPQQ